MKADKFLDPLGRDPNNRKLAVYLDDRLGNCVTMPGTGYYKEIQYLKSKGYAPSKDGLWMVKKNDASTPQGKPKDQGPAPVKYCGNWVGGC